ncbi:hypothetical protein [Halalkalicoccus salilacus]|uniref:hypothetical protein n=1 Tax=Halalkalicoccus salilacus TaxID=3117459 RepID=UPI00300E98C1
MDDDPTDRDPEPFGARPGESKRSDPARDATPDDPDDEDEGWTSEIAIALALVGCVLLIAGLLFAGLGGFDADGGNGGGGEPANNTTNATNASEDLEDVQEDDVENDTDSAGNGEAPDEPEPDNETEPNETGPQNETNETEPGNETGNETNETEPNETGPQNGTEPGNETGNETNETESGPGTTAVIQVVDQAGAPVEASR